MWKINIFSWAQLAIFRNTGALLILFICIIDYCSNDVKDGTDIIIF